MVKLSTVAIIGGALLLLNRKSSSNVSPSITSQDPIYGTAFGNSVDRILASSSGASDAFLRLGRNVDSPFAPGYTQESGYVPQGPNLAQPLANVSVLNFGAISTDLSADQFAATRNALRGPLEHVGITFNGAGELNTFQPASSKQFLSDDVLTQFALKGVTWY